MKSSTGYILICMILLTALLGLIVLLITVTEQPDLIFDESRKDTTFRETDSTTVSTNSTETISPDFDQLEETSPKVSEPNTDFAEQNEQSNWTKIEVASETNSSTVDISILPSVNSNSTQKNLHLSKFSEIRANSPNDGKFVTILAVSENSFYLVKNNGDIELWIYNESFERLSVIHTNIQIHRAKLLHQHSFFVAETVKSGRNKLNRLWTVEENGNKTELANVTNEISDISVFREQFYFLDRAANIYRITDNGGSILEWESATDETCNFMEVAKTSTFVSCQSAILQIQNDRANRTSRRLKSLDSSYSLAVSVLNECLVMAARRGREEVHIFNYCDQTQRPVTILSHADESEKTLHPIGEYWTSVAMLQNSTYLLALEHISNVIYIFTVPPIY